MRVILNKKKKKKIALRRYYIHIVCVCVLLECLIAIDYCGR